MIAYSIFYLVEFILLIGFGFLKNNIFRISAIVLGIIFCGLRYETGYDYNSYVSFFNNLSDYDGLLEPGFYYFVTVANYFKIADVGLFFVFSLLTHWIAYLFLVRTSVNPNIAILVYLLIPGLFLNSFSIVRQALAVSLFAWATYKLVRKDDYLHYIILALFAISFHLPAIIPFSIAFLIFHTKTWYPGRLISISFLALSYIASIISIPQILLGLFIDTKYSYYILNQVPQGDLKIIGNLLISGFIIYHSVKFKGELIYSFYYKLWLMGGCFYYIFQEITPLTRISYYFSILSIPLLVLIPYYHNELKKVICFVSIILFYFLAFLLALYNDALVDDPITMLNYKSIFQKS